MARRLCDRTMGQRHTHAHPLAHTPVRHAAAEAAVHAVAAHRAATAYRTGAALPVRPCGHMVLAQARGHARLLTAHTRLIEQSSDYQRMLERRRRRTRRDGRSDVHHPRPHGRGCACAAVRRRPPRPRALGLLARAATGPSSQGQAAAPASSAMAGLGLFPTWTRCSRPLCKFLGRGARTGHHGGAVTIFWVNA